MVASRAATSAGTPGSAGRFGGRRSLRARAFHAGASPGVRTITPEAAAVRTVVTSCRGTPPPRFASEVTSASGAPSPSIARTTERASAGASGPSSTSRSCGHHAMAQPREATTMMPTPGARAAIASGVKSTSGLPGGSSRTSQRAPSPSSMQRSVMIRATCASSGPERGTTQRWSRAPASRAASRRSRLAPRPGSARTTANGGEPARIARRRSSRSSSRPTNDASPSSMAASRRHASRVEGASASAAQGSGSRQPRRRRARTKHRWSARRARAVFVTRSCPSAAARQSATAAPRPSAAPSTRAATPAARRAATCSTARTV
ncbi:MAG: hypothetical protein U0324_22655 [Polyangiales bacterium]